MIKKRFIGVKELSNYMSVSRNTIYFWIHNKKIPYLKAGRLVRFDLEEIEKWLYNRKYEEKEPRELGDVLDFINHNS